MHPPPRLLGIAMLLAAALALQPQAARGSAGDPGVPRWTWPIDPPREVSRPYRSPATPYSAGHRGIDVDVARGSPVRSPDDGVVRFTGGVGGRPVLSISHDGGLLSSFEPVDAVVREGDFVSRGQVVGTVAASSGHCPVDCLHVGARLDGRYLSPLALLGSLRRSVLLPLKPA